MNDEAIIVERRFNAPANEIWQALTDNDKMKQWYFDFETFKPEVGFQFQFYGGTEENKYLHLCKITEVIPEKKLAYSWRYEGYPGDSLVTFELFAEGESTRVKLTHEGVDTFPADKPDFAKESFVAGWNEIVGTALKDHVETRVKENT